MDVNTLMKLALSASSTNAISKSTTASSDQVSEVLTAVLLPTTVPAPTVPVRTAPVPAPVPVPVREADARDVPTRISIVPDLSFDVWRQR